MLYSHSWRDASTIKKYSTRLPKHSETWDTNGVVSSEVKKLKAEYRKVRDKRNKTGEGRYPEWDFFDPINAILGHKPATQPPVVIQSIAEGEDQEAGASLPQDAGLYDTPVCSSSQTMLKELQLQLPDLKHL